jgi:peptidoglycan hydrolase-like protein with peptidoglycan-binding domain
MAQTGADKLRAWALTFDGLDDYEWGEVPEYEPKDDDPRDGDCSGACYAWWRRGGVPSTVIGGRQTADSYSRMGKSIEPRDAVCGDYIVLLNSSGRAHHIIMCIGKGDTMEAKGEAYGYVRSTVAKAMTRGGARAKRMPNAHQYLGDLTGAAPAGPSDKKPSHPAWPGVYLHQGMRDKGENGAIRIFRGRLKDRGWHISADGVFDQHTHDVVTAFQRQKRLEPDAVVGPLTWNAFWEAPITKD